MNYASFLAEIWPEGVEEWIFRRVIKWIVAPFHGNLSNLSNDPHRTFTISDKEHLQTELNLALQKNGHNKKDIIKIINKHANKTTISDTQPDERIHSPIHMSKEQQIGLAGY